MKSSERIHRAADRIAAVLDAHTTSSADAPAMDELRAIALELGSLDRFTSDKLVELLAKAQVFYGRKSLFRLPGSGRRLWTDMREDLLDRLRMRARVLESQGD
ncbi:MAG TPA: hypothetical protein VF169_22185 [Albitalea sp.]|uniref:hypothetical protein n=1 Tax=Piscinibacter sp. TaxID=1903157 RepID=UPI002ED468AF